MFPPPSQANTIATQRLTAAETKAVETVLRMGSGYVLDFSDRTIAEFFADFQVDIGAETYKDGASPGKANRVRSFLRQTPAPLVGRVMSAMLDHGIETEFADRGDGSAKPTDAQIDEFRRLAKRFGATGLPNQPSPLSARFPAPLADSVRADSSAGGAEWSHAAAAPPATGNFAIGDPRPRRFRVALSFAGEKRDFVDAAARLLAARFTEERVLYDRFHEAEFARADLHLYLPDLYHSEADLVVVVVCSKYDEKEWTGLEWRAIHNLIKQRRDDEVMLCRFEHAVVSGLYDGAGWLELDGRRPADMIRLVLERLAINERRPRDAYTRTIAAGEPTAHRPEPLPPFSIEPEGLAAVLNPSTGYAKLDFVPQFVNETADRLTDISAGLVYYADGDGPPVPRLMQHSLQIRPAAAVRVPRASRTAPNGASLPFYEDVVLCLRHVPIYLAIEPHIGPFQRRGLKGANGILIPRPIGAPVWWRAALWVKCGDQPLSWFQVTVESGANNDQRAGPAKVERMPDGVAPVVGFQVHEYDVQLGRLVWNP